MSTLTEIVQTRVSRETKVALGIEAQRAQRSEAAIVRLALLDYLNRKGKR